MFVLAIGMGKVGGGYGPEQLAADLGYNLSGPGILEESLFEKCNFCRHEKKKFFKKQASGLYMCVKADPMKPPHIVCGCQYCYCNCTHEQHEHTRHQVGCKAEGCRCDISNLTGPIGCPILEIDDYLRSFDMSVTR
jgi:hypothetical protein